MSKIAKKILGLALATVMAATTISPATVQAAPYVSANQTVYRLSSDYSSTTSIYVSNLTKSQTIKKSTVKSSAPKVAKLRYLEKDISDYSYTTQYFSDAEDYTYSNKNYSYYIGVELLKAGKSNISFKIGNKTYKTAITVKNYVNPLSNVTISGINNGKNIAGKLNKQNNTYLKLKKNANNAVIKATAKKGWKITNVYVTQYDAEKDGSYTYYNSAEQYSYSAYRGGKSSVTLKVGNLNSKKTYQVRVQMTNTANGGTITSYYYINW